jgi:hypothetical protein
MVDPGTWLKPGAWGKRRGRRRFALARPSRVFMQSHRTGRDKGFRLRQAFGATSWAESGFHPTIMGPTTRNLFNRRRRRSPTFLC